MSDEDTAKEIRHVKDLLAKNKADLDLTDYGLKWTGTGYKIVGLPAVGQVITVRCEDVQQGRFGNWVVPIYTDFLFDIENVDGDDNCVANDVAYNVSRALITDVFDWRIQAIYAALCRPQVFKDLAPASVTVNLSSKHKHSIEVSVLPKNQIIPDQHLSVRLCDDVVIVHTAGRPATSAIDAIKWGDKDLQDRLVRAIRSYCNKFDPDQQF